MQDTIKDAPIFGMGGLTLYGVQLNDIVLILTLLYTLMRIWVLARNWYKEAKDAST